MPNLKEIRNRIGSVGSTMKITSAMKMVSASKLKRAQDAVISMRPYANKLAELIQQVSAGSNQHGLASTYTEQRPVTNILLVVITSNKGLCGGFNNAVIKKSMHLINETSADVNVAVLVIGKKGNDFFSKAHNVIDNRSDLFHKLIFADTAVVANQLMDLFKSGAYDRIDVVYNRFKNAATQITTVDKFLPITLPDGDDAVASDAIFEPSKNEVLVDLLPKSLQINLHKAIRESFAAEHGARMTAMHKATDNASDLRKELLLSYNKARQAAITNEILEIVGGAEALKG